MKTNRVVISRKPMHFKNGNYKIYFRYSNDLNKEHYNMASKQVAAKWSEPATYEIMSDKTGVGAWWMISMNWVDELPREFDTIAADDGTETYCFKLIGPSEDDTGIVYCSSFDEEEKQYVKTIYEDDFETIRMTKVPLKVGNHYKVVRTEKKSWVWSTLQCNQEDIMNRKSKWNNGQYNDVKVSSSLSDIFGMGE